MFKCFSLLNVAWPNHLYFINYFLQYFFFEKNTSCKFKCLLPSNGVFKCNAQIVWLFRDLYKSNFKIKYFNVLWYVHAVWRSNNLAIDDKKKRNYFLVYHKRRLYNDKRKRNSWRKSWYMFEIILIFRASSYENHCY